MPIDSREFRNALGTFPTGVTVVTTGTAPNFVGMTAQSFSSLSLDPPLVLICVDKKASVRSLLQETSAFTVNVLNEDQEEFVKGIRESGDHLLELIDDHLERLGFSISDPPMHHVSPSP